MHKNLYAIVDNKAPEIVGFIFGAPHDAVAIRMFKDAAMTQNSQIPRHPDDYDLMCLGTLNMEENPAIKPANRLVMAGKTLVAAAFTPTSGENE